MPHEKDHLRSSNRHNNKKKKRQVAFGDQDDEAIDTFFFRTDNDRASWKEIYQSCCLHSAEEWAWTLLGLVCLAACTYSSLLGLQLMGNSAKVLFGCKASSLFGEATNPLTALMTSLLATVLLQSSGTATSIIVALVEENTISVSQGIFMVMGANIGTSVTSTIVSLAQMRDFSQLQRGFAAATIHDMFNFMTVALLFPLECATGYLEHLTSALVAGAETAGRTEKWEGPVKKLVSPLANKILIANKKTISAVAKGDTCESFYPVECDEGLEPSYKTCHAGLIACDKKTNKCPLFFRPEATRVQDQVSGGLCLLLAFVFLFGGMIGTIVVIQRLLRGVSMKVVYTVTHCNGYVAIVIATGLTLLVQSSSMVTSILVPFAAIGAIRLEQTYPLIIGANLGTSLGAVISSLDAYGTNPLQVALAHVFFNITGTLLWYPLPPLRDIPLYAAKRLGHGAYLWRWFPLCYLLVMFGLVPLVFNLLSACFTHGGTGTAVVGGFLSVFLGLGLAGLFVWCKYRGGDQQYLTMIERISGRRVTDTNEETIEEEQQECS